MTSIILAILATIAATICFCSVVTNLLYWYEAISEHGGAALREKYRCRLVPWAVVRMLRTAFTQVFIGLTYPLAPLLHRPVRTLRTGHASESLPPVLLIHGLYHNPSAWCLFMPRLRNMGFGTVRTFFYWSYAANYWDILDRLESEVLEFAEKCDRPVCLVGHSLGGLLLRGLLARPACAGKVAAAVTLGAPHQGSKLATLGIGGLARSLMFRSQLVQDISLLEENTTGIEPVPVLSLYSPIDNMVLPQQGLRLPRQFSHENWEERESVPLDHVAMLYHFGTAAITADFLAKNGHGCSPDQPE